MNLFQRLARGAAFSAIVAAGAIAAPAATHNTAPNQFVEAGGVRYAYRHFGAQTGVPVILLQHFRGNMDYWDPALTDGLAKRRPVYLFDNAGVGLSSGETPDSFEAMADHVAAFAAPVDWRKLTCSAFRSAAWSRRKLRCAIRNWCAG